PGELAAFEDDDLAVHHLEAERLVQSGSEPLPRERGTGLLAGPDVAVRGAEGDAAVRQEVDAGDEEQGVPGVLVGEREGVNDEWAAGVLAGFELGGERIGPARGAWIGQFPEQIEGTGKRSFGNVDSALA